MSYYYERTVYNSYLGLSKIVKAKTHAELEMKVTNQVEIWRKREERERQKELIADMKEQAEFDTEQALSEIEEYRNILSYTLDHNDKVDWNELLESENFKRFNFNEVKPDIKTFLFKNKVPNQSFFEKIFKSIKIKREKLESKTNEEFNFALKEYEDRYDNAKKIYEIEKAEFIKSQEEYNNQVLEFKSNFENGEEQATEDYIRLVLENSIYPDAVSKEFDVKFIKSSKTGIIDYVIPHPEAVPKITEYKFVQTRKEVSQKEMKKKEFEEFYEGIVYQIALRTLHELYESVYNNQLELVIFNGWIEGVDSATGQDFTSCIVSLQSSREEFEDINLARINPKECFRSLKGISAGALKNLAPVKPIMNINRFDSRFTESKDVMAEINSIPNLADMDWEDFEHLVRGLFENIFNENGGEVKVTQASRDGGVDAIAFDSDPIRGGKFVIQAKRYNKVVPVSAARDLYGTMINEGAAKGILVTTSYFGKDTLEFVKDKPISLIDGSNLIHLFGEQGQMVRIELKKN
ncbi:MAG: restriction endonuclease [Bacillota bacterium]